MVTAPSTECPSGLRALWSPVLSPHCPQLPPLQLHRLPRPSPACLGPFAPARLALRWGFPSLDIRGAQSLQSSLRSLTHSSVTPTGTPTDNCHVPPSPYPWPLQSAVLFLSAFNIRCHLLLNYDYYLVSVSPPPPHVNVSPWGEDFCLVTLEPRGAHGRCQDVFSP